MVCGAGAVVEACMRGGDRRREGAGEGMRVNFHPVGREGSSRRLRGCCRIQRQRGAQQRDRKGSKRGVVDGTRSREFDVSSLRVSRRRSQRDEEKEEVWWSERPGRFENPKARAAGGTRNDESPRCRTRPSLCLAMYAAFLEDEVPRATEGFCEDKAHIALQYLDRRFPRGGDRDGEGVDGMMILVRIFEGCGERGEGGEERRECWLCVCTDVGLPVAPSQRIE